MPAEPEPDIGPLEGDPWYFAPDPNELYPEEVRHYTALNNWSVLYHKIHRIFRLRRLWSWLGQHLRNFSRLR